MYIEIVRRREHSSVVLDDSGGSDVSELKWKGTEFKMRGMVVFGVATL